MECPRRPSARYAGQASNSWNVPGAPLLDTQATPAIPGMSLWHLCWIRLPGLQFLGNPWRTPAEYVGQASNSWNVLGASLLDTLARPSIPGMSLAHLCWIRRPGLQFLECLWRISAGYAGQAFDSWNVPGARLVDTLTRPSIPGMSLAHLC